MAKDYYKTLGVGKNASQDEIKKAFRKMAHQYHPDKNKGDDSKFKEINEAYRTLSDEKKRAQYDQFGSDGPSFAGGGYGAGNQGFGGFDFSGFQNGQGFDMGDLGDIFSDFFSAQGGPASGWGGSRTRRGRDISTEISLAFSEAVFGVEKTIAITKQSTCETCKGSGAKPGTKMKTCAKCKGQGQIRQTKRSILGTFENVTMCDECFGSGQTPEEKCGTCKGHGVHNKQETIKLTIPSGINNGEMVKLSGYGEAVSHGKTGDLYVKIKIKKPGKLSQKAKEALEVLQKEGI
jgi:molecular chaperone DnaJ